MADTINFGIDLGTTNSAIAKYENGEVLLFKNPTNLKQTLSSVVAFKGDRIIVGDKAREFINKSPNNVFGSFKRKMGTSEKYFCDSTGEMLSPLQLSGFVLKELKNFIHTGEYLESAVITIPAAFDTIQSNATKKAGLEAGIEEVVLLQEPIAASLAYANKSGDKLDLDKWLVYDFGGGTFDVALVTVVDDEMKVLDHEGDNFLGGRDFDTSIIFDYIVPEVEKLGDFSNLESEMKKQSGKYHKLYNKLTFIAEGAKIELTHNDVADIEFDIIDDNGKEIEVYLQLPRDKFHSILEPFFNRTLEMINTVISRNNITPQNLDCILDRAR